MANATVIQKYIVKDNSQYSKLIVVN